ncbi:MAG: hypothetical protein KFB96_06500 [Thiocapsa sp.]|uniref:3-dehydroquinate synthase family protein n=1 Tax=Thiocapsa sp. TaxID=2024551 RepID=UPI001BCC7447|nr:hypothetical protein [Thiocapsa sp.]QVL50110.1 MAG: hypothetical protein KFB96_06500 [Thiocapsa sp.]
MSDSLSIRSIFRDYKVEFTSEFLDKLKILKLDGDLVVVDSTVLLLYPEIRLVAGDDLWAVDGQESLKSYEGVIPLFQRLIEGGFHRDNRIIAIGGGITQDIASFVSSLLYRGVDWYFFPTNMLTQCDSCIGSKTSINFRQYKNQIGGFYPPAEVIIDTNFLKSLSRIEVASGLGEMLHYFLLNSEEDLELFWKYAPEIRSGNDLYKPLILRSLTIKKAMIELDEFDRGPRNIFNYGHSFGHAIESATNYAVPHGIAVAYGIDLANLVSVMRGLLQSSERNRIRRACELVFDGFSLPSIEMYDYMAAMKRDKKNVGQRLGLILTRGVGDMFKELCEVNDDLHNLIASFFTNKLYLTDI